MRFSKIQLNKSLKCAAVFLVVVGTGCASQSVADGPKFVSGMDYFLVQTRLNIDVNFKLRQCHKSNGDAEVKIDTSGKVAVLPDADRNNKATIEGIYLKSSRTKHDLKVELHENRSLKSVNRTSSDETFAIIGNVLNVVGSIFGLVSPAAAPAGVLAAFQTGTPPASDFYLGCTADAIANLDAASKLKTEISSLSDDLADSGISEKERLSKVQLINQLALKLADLRTGALKIDKSTKADFSGSGLDSVVELKGVVFKNWLTICDGGDKKTCKPIVDASDLLKDLSVFKLDADIVTSDPDQTVSVSSLQSLSESLKEDGAKCNKYKDPESCVKRFMQGHLFVREIPEMNVKLKLTSWNKPGSSEELATLSNIPAPHLGEVKYIPMDVKLGEKNTIGFTFDPYGRSKSFTWASDARASSVTAGLAGSISSAKSVISGIEGPSETALQKAKIDALETQMNYNKMLLCEAAIEAGATSCP